MMSSSTSHWLARTWSCWPSSRLTAWQAQGCMQLAQCSWAQQQLSARLDAGWCLKCWLVPLGTVSMLLWRPDMCASPACCIEGLCTLMLLPSSGVLDQVLLLSAAYMIRIGSCWRQGWVQRCKWCDQAGGMLHHMAWCLFLWVG